MQSVKKIKSTNKKYDGVIVVEDVTSHANDPFVLKKVAKAKEIIGKIKFPDNLIK